MERAMQMQGKTQGNRGKINVVNGKAKPKQKTMRR
jgi:hypothetical protein